jgi:hypothetical protein
LWETLSTLISPQKRIPQCQLLYILPSARWMPADCSGPRPVQWPKRLRTRRRKSEPPGRSYDFRMILTCGSPTWAIFPCGRSTTAGITGRFSMVSNPNLYIYLLNVDS